MQKGFTLIETMVVVVIMGVLAAIGVPKLFGVIAKARAAEVPVAAGTYVNVQNAFLVENNGIGGWQNIGYGAPGGSDGKTEYFEYTGCINGVIPFENMEPDMPGWQASNRHKLNYCGAGSAWAVVIDPAGERAIEYRRLISSMDCEALTINWGSVGKTVEGMCETTGELHVVENDNEKPDTPQEPQEGSSASEDPSSSTSGSNSSSNSNTEQQGDCEALAASINNENGNKYGWVCVSECGLFAPPGKARNAGFEVDKSQKKKNTGGVCEKTTPENGSGNNGNQGGNNSSASTSGGNSANATNSANGGGEQQGEGENGENGSEQGSGSGGGGSQSGGGSNNSGSGTMGEVQYPNYNGNGEPHAFNSESDYCDGTIQDGVCEGSYRPNDECSTWNKNDCNKGNKVKNKNRTTCGDCKTWAASD